MKKPLFLLAAGLIFAQTQVANAADHIIAFKDAQAMQSALKNPEFKKQVVSEIKQINTVVVNEAAMKTKSLSIMSHRVRYTSPVLEIHVVRDHKKEKSPANVMMGLWGMRAIHAEDAWKLGHQGEGITVAVSDTGVYIAHPDLADNIWKNPGEAGLDSNGKKKWKNKIDDDGNGFVDDLYGWDFTSKRPAVLDNYFHGSHVAGTIAAELNDYGVVGAAPKANIMVTTFLNGQGSGTDAGGAASLIYAADNGAKIINCSWGGEGESQIIKDAVAYAQKKNVLVVAAAGNSSKDTDLYPQVPSALDLDNIISVGAMNDEKGQRAGFSNFGLHTVDIAAPGDRILSTWNAFWGFFRMYDTISGTSMATPHVAGVAALVWSVNPNFSWKQVKDIILTSAEPNKYWQGKSVTGGLLRADKAVQTALRVSQP